MAQAEVYEVATFYAHFDVVKEGEAPPPPVTVRVCENLSCNLAGAEKLIADLNATTGADVRVVRAPCMGHCHTAPVAEVGHYFVDHADAAAVNEGDRRAPPRSGDSRRTRTSTPIAPTAATGRCERLRKGELDAASSWSTSSTRRACAAAAARASRPRASGSRCWASRARA